MKTVVVLSDTHGNANALAKISDVLDTADVIVHLGDGAGEVAHLLGEYGDKVISVTGNCDAFGVQEEYTFEVENVRFFACHGHKYGVKQGLTRLSYRAEEVGASVALYGHTHIAGVTTIGKTLTLNPGTMSLSSPIKSFAYVVVHGEKVTATINDKRNL